MHFCYLYLIYICGVDLYSLKKKDVEKGDYSYTVKLVTEENAFLYQSNSLTLT